MTDLATFARWQVASGDMDPVYPVLGALADRWGLDPAQRVRAVLLYVAYYDLPSAVCAWHAGNGTWDLPHYALSFPCGTERRGHRDPRKLAAHLAALPAAEEALGAPLDNDPRAAWVQVQGRLREVWGNGRWAAYKTGEMLATVCGGPLAPTDAGHEFSTGPRHGLELLDPRARIPGNGPAVVATLNALTDELVAELGLPVEQVETVLCDFHSLARGRYYVGHDIDLMWGQIRAHPELTPAEEAELRDARLRAFHPFWLGEVGGWGGVRPALRPLYRDQGAVEWWTVDRRAGSPPGGT